jgi:hypothetical protein
MRTSFRILLGALAVAACLPVVPAAAQPVVRSFEDLQGLLAPGDHVVVVDRGGRAIWGRVTAISPTTLTVAELQRRDGRVESASERIAYTPERVQTLFLSDATGMRGPAIYPASWHAVESLPPGSDLDVVAASGERRRYRFAGATAEGVRLVGVDGVETLMNRSQVARIERRGVDDSVGNGIAIGALIGAGTGLTVAWGMFAACGDGCEAPDPGPTYAAAIGFAAGIGAAAGWVIDKAHKGKAVVFPVVAPIVSREAKGVAVVVRF